MPADARCGADRTAARTEPRRRAPRDRDAPALEALTAVRRIGARGALREAVVYGDPSPEIIVTERPGQIALIDWGTPSWGPLAHDVAVWLRLVAPRPDDAKRARRFLTAYEGRVQLRDGERDALPSFHRLHSALGLVRA